VRLVKRLLLGAFARAERPFEYAFGQRGNPFTWLGALGWYFYWITAATGIYLYIFFDTGIVEAYASVEYMTNEQWYAAGIMRSLHRYASDALVIVVVLHVLREFGMDRLRGKHFFAWLTGVPLLAFIYVCGISGYWLVWDKLAQYIAVATSEWLDALPFFAEPIANNFLDSTTLGGRFFTLMVLVHIFAPLFMLLLMWVHVQRHSQARVNPPRSLAIGTMVALVVLSVVYPAVSQGPADLDAVPAEVNLDWFYLAGYPLLDVVPGGQLWLYLAGGFALLLALPWLPPERNEPEAVVNLENCNGCARCFDDCPFGALMMVPRSDGRPYELEPLVNPGSCTSCGICAGSCPTSTPFRRAKPIEPGIELPHRSIANLREQLIAPMDAANGKPRVIVFGCDRSNAERLADGEGGVRVIKLPCVGMLPPSFIDFALSRDFADGVLLAGCAENDCFHRLGNEWTIRRLARQRDPQLRQRVPPERLKASWLPPDDHRRRARALGAFRRRLLEMQDA
jgi:ferredoxin/coenzyme F420-reducing hydrogenase delta subunit